MREAFKEYSEKRK